jgi:hypothetical protein
MPNAATYPITTTIDGINRLKPFESLSARVAATSEAIAPMRKSQAMGTSVTRNLSSCSRF